MVVDLPSGRRTDVLKALSEPARWRIVECLSAEELCVCHLVEDLDIAQPLVSHHLKVLREAGVVESDRFKQWVYYRLTADALTAVAAEVAAVAKRSRSAARHRRPCC